MLHRDSLSWLSVGKLILSSITKVVFLREGSFLLN